MSEPRQLNFGWSFKREINLGQVFTILALCGTLGSVYMAKERWCVVTDSRLASHETALEKTAATVRVLGESMQRVQLDQMRIATLLERKSEKGN